MLDVKMDGNTLESKVPYNADVGTVPGEKFKLSSTFPVRTLASISPVKITSPSMSPYKAFPGTLPISKFKSASIFPTKFAALMLLNANPLPVREVVMPCR